MKIQSETLSILKDDRVNCYSVMTTLTVKDYLALVNNAYKNRGGIEGQRDPLRTRTAIQIRNRMIEDLKAGAVLPPIVLGLVVFENELSSLGHLDCQGFQKFLDKIPQDSISIIDGMQRTAALLAVARDNGVNEKTMRVEYWIASSTNDLIYRMLVLNTGQVPWDLRRQIEVVFQSMIQEMKKKVPDIEILVVDDQKRRSKPGVFQAKDLIELFLVFGARKEKIDIKERLADEFTRLDFIEATASPEFTNMFYQVLDDLSKLDKLFGKYQGASSAENGRFKDGKDLFTSQPVRVGFVTAIAQEVLGRPGTDYPQDKQERRWQEIQKSAESRIARLEQMSSDEIGEFLDFPTLNQAIPQKSGRIGDVEREFFVKAFRTLIDENFDPPTMAPCWRAY